MVSREEFESWPTKKQRSYIARIYPIVCKEWKEELMDADLYRCPECGNRADSFHHIWKKSHSPLWFQFQTDNLLPVCSNCHPRKFHDIVCELNSQDYIDRQMEIMKQQEAEYQKQYRA